VICAAELRQSNSIPHRPIPSGEEAVLSNFR
jgi:hypothetical protein